MMPGQLGGLRKPREDWQSRRQLGWNEATVLGPHTHADCKGVCCIVPTGRCSLLLQEAAWGWIHTPTLACVHTHVDVTHSARGCQQILQTLRMDLLQTNYSPKTWFKIKYKKLWGSEDVLLSLLEFLFKSKHLCQLLLKYFSFSAPYSAPDLH